MATTGYCSRFSRARPSPTHEAPVSSLETHGRKPHKRCVAKKPDATGGAHRGASRLKGRGRMRYEARSEKQTLSSRLERLCEDQLKRVAQYGESVRQFSENLCMLEKEAEDFTTSGGRVFGWRDQRRIDGEQVQFALEKSFQYSTVEELAANT